MISLAQKQFKMPCVQGLHGPCIEEAQIYLFEINMRLFFLQLVIDIICLDIYREDVVTQPQLTFLAVLIHCHV